MPQHSKRPGEFRRYRAALTWIYVSVAASGFALLTVSVFKYLLVGPAMGTADRLDRSPEAMLRCEARVSELLLGLSTETCALLDQPPRSGVRGELASQWEAFSRDWNEKWRDVGARCGFAEPAETEREIAGDRIALVHRDLLTVKQKYRNLLVRFDEEQAAELARMRRALDESKAALQERVGGGR